MSPILGIYASQISGHLVTNNYSSIQTVTVGSGGASSITFSSIPSTYTHLQLRAILRTAGGSSGGSQCQITVNGDGGSNYSYHRLAGNGSSTPTEGSGNNSYAYGLARYPQNGDLANDFGVVIIDVLDYANTSKTKTFRSLAGYDANGSGQVQFASAGWLSTSAITNLVITDQSGFNWAQYSQFALYGVR